MSSAQPQRVTDRLAFLLALVPYLLEFSEGVPVAQAAAHFDVPPQDVRDAVSLIAVSGVPGESRQYQHNDLFDIDWEAFEERDRLQLTHHVAIDESPRLSNREAAALIASLQYLSALPENADRAALASLQAKLTLGSSGEPSAIAVDAEGRPQALEPIRRAIAERCVLRFRYLNGRGVHEERAVEPLRVESVDASWYLRGWDQARRALRTFRLDRMEDVREDPGTPPAERPLDVEIPDRIFSPSPTDRAVILEVAEAALPVLTDYLDRRSHIAALADRPGWLRVELRIAHMAGLKRLVTGTPGLIQVVEPADAREAVADWAAAGAARYPPPRRARKRRGPDGSAVSTAQDLRPTTVAADRSLTMFGNLTGVHFLILAGVVVLLFGASKLPVFSKNLGQSIKIFRREMHDVRTESQDDRRVGARDEERPVVYTDEPPARSDEPRRATGAAAPRVPGSPQR